MREAVRLLEISNFAEYEIAGPGGRGPAASQLLANRMPPRSGRLLLSPMLNHRDRLIGDFTVGKLAEERFYIFGASIAEEYHLRWFEAQLPDLGVSVRSLRRLVGLQIAGPKARELLSRVTAEDVSNAALPFMAFRRIDIGMVPALLGRISFTGELGYELWVAPEYQIALYDLLVAAEEDPGADPLRQPGAQLAAPGKGLRLLDTLKYTPDYDPVSAASAALPISARTPSSAVTPRSRRVTRQRRRSSAASRSRPAMPTRSPTSRSTRARTGLASSPRAAMAILSGSPWPWATSSARPSIPVPATASKSSAKSARRRCFRRSWSTPKARVCGAESRRLLFR